MEKQEEIYELKQNATEVGVTKESIDTILQAPIELQAQLLKSFIQELIQPKEEHQQQLIQDKGEYQRQTQQLRQEKEEYQRQRIQYKTENSLLMASAIEIVYGSTVDTFRLPHLTVNTAVKPSCGNTRMASIKDGDGKDTKVEMKIPEPEIETCKPGMWLDPNKVRIPARDQRGRCLLPSRFNAMTDPPLEYANELGVQVYCQQLIEDALYVLGLAFDVKRHFEVSIYTMKPDRMLVLKYQGRIVFVAMVKSPETQKDEVFGSKAVAGQVWSYLYAMRASGIEVPMGAIMTFNKIVLVSLEDYSSNGDHRARVEKAANDLSTGNCPDLAQEQENTESCENRETFLTKDNEPFEQINVECNGKTRSEIYNTTEQNGESNQEMKIDKEQNVEDNMKTKESVLVNIDPETIDAVQPVNREVYFSEVYEEGLVFPCLVQALHIAFRYVKSSPAKKLVHLENGANLANRFVFKLGKSSFDWGKTNATIKGVAFTASVSNNIPTSSSKTYLILEKLGEGNKASVYLACNNTGVVCAMKDYFMYPSSASTNEVREEHDNEARLLLYSESKEEEELWNDIYEGRFEARVVYLGAKPCLIMPYGYQISCNKTRFSLVPEIRYQLYHLARKSYVYDQRYLRWCHILLDHKKEVFLCDLDSLVPLTEDVNKVVFEQLSILLRLLVVKLELDTSETLAWVTDPKSIDDVAAFISDHAVVEQLLPNNTTCMKTYLQSLFPQGTSNVEILQAEAKVVLYMLAYYRANNEESGKRIKMDTLHDKLPEFTSA